WFELEIGLVRQTRSLPESRAWRPRALWREAVARRGWPRGSGPRATGRPRPALSLARARFHDRNIVCGELDVVTRAAADENGLGLARQVHGLRCAAMVDQDPDRFAGAVALAHLDVLGHVRDQGFDGAVAQEALGHLSHERRIEPRTDVGN